MTTVAIHQPNFFPWFGYFDKIKKCDYFVFLDDVQYTRGTMLNRAKICSNLITCPVNYTFGQKINDVLIDESRDYRWKNKLLKTIAYNSREEVSHHISNIILNPFSRLYMYNISNIVYICMMLGIRPKKGFIIQSDLGNFATRGQELIADIVGYLGGDTYYSGTGSKEYMDEYYMNDRGIKVSYQDSSKFPDCSIIDCILNKKVLPVI